MSVDGSSSEKDVSTVTKAHSDQKILKTGSFESHDIIFDESFEDEDIEIVTNHINDHSVEESLEIIKEAIEYHDGDTGLSNDFYLYLIALTEGPDETVTQDQWETLVKFHAFLIHDWSIYPAVRSVTRPIDEEEFEDYENIRVYLISIIWSCAGSVLATFFMVRFPSISLSSVAIQILIAYTGKAMSGIPNFSFPVGFGRRCTFGGGKWNYKEQMLATCGMGVGNQFPYSQYVVLALGNSYFYNFQEAISFGFIILLTLSTNLMGFGLAGIFRVFLIYPVRMIWYGVLPGLKLSRTLVSDDPVPQNNTEIHVHEDVGESEGDEKSIAPKTSAWKKACKNVKGSYYIYLYYFAKWTPGVKIPAAAQAEAETRLCVNGWRLKGWEFFWLFSILEFGWYWITDFVFIFLGYFDWMSWINPNDNNLLAICGVNNGLALNPFPSLDPSIFLPTAMVSPFFSTVSMLAGMIISMLIVIGIWYQNTSYTGFLPINSNTLYDNTGNEFEVSQVLNDNNELDEEKYQSYSLPFWSAGSLVSYGAFFAFYPAMIVYSILNYTGILWYSMKVLWKGIINPRAVLANFNDRYSRAQRKYKEVPEWWYLLFLAICLGMGIACVEHYKFTNTPVWTIFFGIGLSAVFMVPCGVLYATTNQQIVINVLYELIIGLTNEGNGTALMVAKAYATNFMVETDSFITNLKQAHYVGLAPRAMFRIQIVNCIANSFVQSGLMLWQATPGSIDNLCSLDNATTNKFTCQDIRVYFNAAVQWGTIGPRRIFQGLYPNMPYTFLVGALYPIPFWLVRRYLVKYARDHKWGAPKEGGGRFRNFTYVRYLFSLEWINSSNEIIFISGALNWAPYNLAYYWPWFYVGLAFQVIIPRYYPRWWSQYNYLLYAAISVGYSYSALIMFFATSYHHLASIDWWGNDAGVSLMSVPRLNATLDAPDGYFGPRVGDYP
ncbi:Opt2 protein [Starmerella bacillaris]|uniref:Opt2 protein n=1 Tax=Starmerella bacillaris TaxID=1247836 RepID=A0AAV5RJ66_STABA|nr:Opt2 protein [Starmerella bacillaris]